MVQLREKGRDLKVLLDHGYKLKMTLDCLGVPLIINDDAEIAQKLDASGVHLGKEDGSVIRAREILGPDKIIGMSIESEMDLEYANSLPLDYVAASAVFSTANKSNVRKLWGLDGLRALASMSKHRLIAIGGINLSNVESVLDAGARGIAVIGALHDAKDPMVAARSLRHQIDCQIDNGGWSDAN